MRFEPLLTIRRLVIIKNEARVFDQTFELGVNMFSGENGSGKTTIADFLFFGLGGEPHSWRKAALECDRVYTEVSFNDEEAVLSREVSSSPRRPIRFFWGSFEEAEKAPLELWHEYPAAAMGSKASFSQVIFTSLGVPEVQVADSTRITMHQLLRLLYVDQTTPFDELFISEDFDRHDLRAAVGDLLLGIYDHRIYECRENIRALESERTALLSNLRYAQSLLGASGNVFVPEYIDVELARHSEQRAALYADLEREPVKDGPEPAAAEIASSGIAEELTEANLRCAEAEEKHRRLQLEVEDSELFVQGLELRLAALKEAAHTKELLGAVDFKVCPACHGALPAREPGRCVLCGREIVNAGDQENRLGLRNEIEQQIGESVRRLEQLRGEREAVRGSLPSLRERRKTLQLRFNEQSGLARSAAEVLRGDILRKIGYLDSQIEELLKKRELAVRLAEFSERHQEIDATLAKLRDEIVARLAIQEKRREECTRAVSTGTVALLREDLPREAEFQTAESVSFDFGLLRRICGSGTHDSQGCGSSSFFVTGTGG